MKMALGRWLLGTLSYREEVELLGAEAKSQNLGKYVWVGAGHGSLWLEPGEMK